MLRYRQGGARGLSTPNVVIEQPQTTCPMMNFFSARSNGDDPQNRRRDTLINAVPNSRRTALHSAGVVIRIHR